LSWNGFDDLSRDYHYETGSHNGVIFQPFILCQRIFRQMVMEYIYTLGKSEIKNIFFRIKQVLFKWLSRFSEVKYVELAKSKAENKDYPNHRLVLLSIKFVMI